MSADVKLRDQAERLAKADTEAALTCATAISAPLYRVQALAWIARYSAKSEVRKILAMARSVSVAAEDPYIVVASSAWRIRALIERGEVEYTQAEVSDLTNFLNSIPHPVSRVEAADLLFHAVFQVDSLRAFALQKLIDACSVADSWKSGARLSEAAVMLAYSDHPEEADLVLASMKEGRYRRQAVTRIQHGVRREPRAFFW